MIEEFSRTSISKILIVINDSAMKYKGIIPNYCWNEPYMTNHQLQKELLDGVRMFGYIKNKKLLGVMGIQELKDVILIRHAYTLTTFQNMGVGSELISYMLNFSIY